MKKLFTLLCASAIAAGAVAQDSSEKTYHFYWQPTSHIFYFSPNGKYVSGENMNSMEGYVWEFASDNAPFTAPYDNAPGAVFGQVAENGTTVGFTSTGTPIVVSIDGKVTELPVPDDVMDEENPISYQGYAFGISGDASIVCGTFLENEVTQNAVIWRDGKYELLPCPTNEELGFEASGSRADYISADGSVIAGAIIDDLATNPAIIWIRQEDGSYKPNFIAKPYFAASIDDLESPYVTFTLSNQSGYLSPNGKWLALSVGKNSWEPGEMNLRMARYNVETNELTVHEFDKDREDVDVEAEAYATGISNDGTIVGRVDDGMSRIGVIWYPDSEQAELLSTKYETMANLDEIANTPMGISADGRFISGFAEVEVTGEYADKYGDSMFAGYVLDTQYEGSSIRDIATDAANSDEVVTAVYDLTGKKVANSAAGLEKGLYIMTTNTGRASKTIVR